MSSSLNKRKTAILLYQIEEALGNYIIDNANLEELSNSKISEIFTREANKGNALDVNSLSNVIEKTYLDEVFSFSLDITKNTTSYDKILYLRDLFHKLGVYEIRNVISHPNNVFLDCYWYRVASIASDPVIEILGLDEITKTLISSEKGILEDPPEEWYKKSIWQIANNLPEKLDHAVTGLIGRNKEIQTLNKYLINPRINTVAIVAPGGLGKTAIALDILNSLILSPETRKWAEAVVFVSMKTEKLTAQGVIDLDAIETIDQLKTDVVLSVNDIFDDEIEEFDSLITDYYDKKLLLFIDNLETLLRDNPHVFEELNNSLPPSWRVLVTSRISINNASVISLQSLTASSAEHLARLYVTRRGGENLDSDSYKRIAKQCHYNPLAIRLTLDLLISGKELPESISVANKEIAEFSYNNLIEVLSHDSVKILEAIFVEDKSNRLSLCETLEMTMDEVAKGVTALSSTSLISRRIHNNTESYQLNTSVRDLLLRSPRNIQVRNEVQNSIRKRRALAQEIDIKQSHSNLSSLDINYIPEDTNEGLKILVTNLNKNIFRKKRNTNSAISLYKEFNDAKHIYENEWLFHRSFARIKSELRDVNGTEAGYIKAIELNSNDHLSKLLLAQHYHRQLAKYDKAEESYETLITDDWDELLRQDKKFCAEVLDGYFLSILFQHKYELILEKTKRWKEDENFSGILGSFRAGAWKRKMENIVESDPDTVVDSLWSAVRIIDDVFKNEGYIFNACQQGLKIFEEIEYCFSRTNYSGNYQDKGFELLCFIEKHIIEISTVMKKFSTKESVVFIKKLRKIKINDNPFNKYKWSNYIQPMFTNGIDYSDALSSGLTIIKVTHIPIKYNKTSTFIFGEDEQKTRFFLHFDTLENGGWQDWKSIRNGVSLAIEKGEEGKNGKDTPSKKTYLVRN